MKIIPIGRCFINLDKVIMITAEKELILEGGNKLKLSNEDLHEFVKNYNLMDTDEVKDLTKKAIQVLFTNPQYLTEEGVRAEIKRLVDMHDLKDFVIKHNKGKKMRELDSAEVTELYKAIVEKIKKDNPF